jgi:peptidyl-prolyl cis-trans isomerase C
MNMKMAPMGWVGLTTWLLVGCDSGSGTGQMPIAPGPVAVTINGQPISESAVKIFSGQFVQQPGVPGVPPDLLVRELVNRELLRQEAVSRGWVNDPELLGQLENATRLMVSQLSAEKFKADVNIPEEELRRLYLEDYVAKQPMEFRARHILVASEQDAIRILADLAKGEKFDVLAKKYSEDAATKSQGGVLDWFVTGQMVPPFSEAVEQLKNGETTQKPVHSQYGWHIIQREDARQKAAPAFETVKDQLKRQQVEKLLREHIETLRSKAAIDGQVKPSSSDTEVRKNP